MCGEVAWRQASMPPGARPIVELGVTHWTSRRFGKIAAPALPVVGWLDEYWRPIAERLGERIDDAVVY
jgi:hypothetical protein